MWMSIKKEWVTYLNIQNRRVNVLEHTIAVDQCA